MEWRARSEIGPRTRKRRSLSQSAQRGTGVGRVDTGWGLVGASPSAGLAGTGSEWRVRAWN